MVTVLMATVSGPPYASLYVKRTLTLTIVTRRVSASDCVHVKNRESNLRGQDAVVATESARVDDTGVGERERPRG